MPKVGDKDFPYTDEGIKQAAAESAVSGIPVSNAGERNVTTYAGGGKTGYNVPQPRMDDAGILEYKKGGKTGPKGEKIPKGSSVSSLKQRANIKKSKRKKGEKPAPPFSTRFGRSILDEDKK